MDEDLREVGLHALRRRNNEIVIMRLREIGVSHGERLLDVGCAHGWFLEAARRHGFTVSGIEPDQQLCAESQGKPYAVRQGLFPEVLAPGETYDVITFNDVLEHIPDVTAALSAARKHLSPSGLLSLNLPSSNGIVFRVSTGLARQGVLGSVHQRLWQVGLPSPHLWYFDPGHLRTLGERVGLELVFSGSLPAMSARGLWSRIHFDRKPSPLTLGLAALGYLSAPLLNAPRWSDIMHLVFRRPGD